MILNTPLFFILFFLFFFFILFIYFLENLLLRTKGDTSQIKIIDFGFSKNCERTQSFLGTHGYLAPEMMNREE